MPDGPRRDAGARSRRTRSRRRSRPAHPWPFPPGEHSWYRSLATRQSGSRYTGRAPDERPGDVRRWPVMRRDGVDNLFDRTHEPANNKVVLIDDHTVITGSYNFTRAAEEKNAENIVIINDERVVSQYLENYEKHREHAKKPRPTLTGFGYLAATCGGGVSDSCFMTVFPGGDSVRFPPFILRVRPARLGPARTRTSRLVLR